MSMAGHFYNTMILLKANTLFEVRIYGKQQNAISVKVTKQIIVNKPGTFSIWIIH